MNELARGLRRAGRRRRKREEDVAGKQGTGQPTARAPGGGAAQACSGPHNTRISDLHASREVLKHATRAGPSTQSELTKGEPWALPGVISWPA